MNTESRTDQAHDINYPKTPDARGTARVYHLRSPYYMGPHESPVSYVVFGLWKHRLMKTGVAPATKDLRLLAESLLEVEPVAKRPKRSSLLMALVFAFICLLCGLAGSKISSTQNSAVVDGLPLSANELEFIRGRRDQLESFAKFQQKIPLSQEVEMTAALNTGSIDRNAILERIRGF